MRNSCDGFVLIFTREKCESFGTDEYAHLACEERKTTACIEEGYTRDGYIGEENCISTDENSENCFAFAKMTRRSGIRGPQRM